MSLPGIDLLELERYQRLEHHEMFKRLRAESPIYWHDHPQGRGFWNLVKYDDVVTPRSRPAARAWTAAA